MPRFENMTDNISVLHLVVEVNIICHLLSCRMNMVLSVIDKLMLCEDLKH